MRLFVLLILCQLDFSTFAEELNPVVARHAHALPRIADPAVDAMVRDKETFFYDSETMPRVYQHNGGAHSPLYNIAGDGFRKLDPFGNGNIEFPWGTPAGMHRVTDGSSVKFMRLPVSSGGDVRPVVYTVRSDGFIRWTFPAGAVFGELLTVKDSSGTGHVFEVRTRTKLKDRSWAVDVFRPFPTKAKYKAALGKRGIKLKEKGFMRLTLAARHPSRPFEQTALGDELEPVSEDVVKELLGTPFESCFGAAWVTGDEVDGYAPTNEAAGFHIVPQHYDGALLPVDPVSCARCHSDTGKDVDETEPVRDWYGHHGGNDGNHSWSPFDQSCVSYDGYTYPVRFRPELLARKLFVPYDPQLHHDYR